MGKISGDLKVMTLADLVQWVDMSNKSGMLTLSRQGASRVLFLQEGSLVFAAAHASRERLGDFLVASRLINKEQLILAVRESQKLQIPFTSFMINEKMVDRQALDKIVSRYAEAVIADVLKWKGGTFEFSDELPVSVLNGPLRINASLILFNAVKAMDESGKDAQPDENLIIHEIAHKIREGKIEIPPLPDILTRVNEAIDKEAPANQIAKIIMSDQILTTKILKVVNSAYYSPPQQITSLKQAAVYIGFKSILSVVTAHAMSGLGGVGSKEQIKEVLRHSLVCAFISRTIAKDLALDPDELFVCGLLHDIGKTVLYNQLKEYRLSDEVKKNLVRRYHASAGLALARQWKLSETIGHVARYHHAPDNAPSSGAVVGAVALANILANSSEGAAPELPPIETIDVQKVRIEDVLKELDGIRNAAAAMI